MTTELDRKLIWNVVEFARPLLAVSDPDAFADFVTSVGWDSEVFGIQNADTLASAVANFSSAIQSLESLFDKDSIELEELAEALVPMSAAIVQFASAVSSLTPTSGTPGDALELFG